MRKVREPVSKFVRITCPSCNNEQVIFGKASSKVKCVSCKKPVLKSSGGKSVILAKVKEVL